MSCQANMGMLKIFYTAGGLEFIEGGYNSLKTNWFYITFQKLLGEGLQHQKPSSPDMPTKHVY